LKVCFNDTVPIKDPVLGVDAVPGSVVAIQSFGDSLGFNPYLHVLSTDGCFYGKGMFRVETRSEANRLEKILLHRVFKMLLFKKER
jgi:hypothetical protein